MKFREIFRFELTYQLRRVWTWLYFAVVLLFSYQIAREAFANNVQPGYNFNGPWVVSNVMIFASMVGLMISTALSGDSAARDVHTRMYPLIYTTPVGKAAYLGGRFLAAFVLNASMLAIVPILLFMMAILRQGSATLLGPFHAASYLTPLLAIALPNAFIVTALLFTMAALSRRSMVSYLGSLGLFGATVLSWQLLAFGAWLS